MPKEYIFFCDESLKRGAYFSNFYGGARVSSDDITGVNDRMTAKKAALGLRHEVKWQNVDAKLVDRYEQMMAALFDEVRAGKVALRIMFTQNVHVPTGLTHEQQAEEYFILYYQFLKHAFGLASMPPHSVPPRVRIYLDEIGETAEAKAKFRGYVAGLSSIRQHQNPVGFTLEDQDITEVRSHEHIVMECLDVVLGAMCFRLNEKHLELLPGKKRRGKRTIAKERLYRFILSLVKEVTKKPNFNLGISTGLFEPKHDLWTAPYLHWRFVPSEHRVDSSFKKPR